MPIYSEKKKIKHYFVNLNYYLIAFRLLGCYTVSNLTIGGEKMDNQSKFCIELKALVNSICRKMAQQPFTKGKETFTSMQVWIIHYLYDNQDRDIFQRDLEADFNVRRSTVTGILQNLEKKGLIQRQSVAQDARLKKITLTEEANTLYNEMLMDIISMEQFMTKNVTEEEWAVFYHVLEKIKKNLE